MNSPVISSENAREARGTGDGYPKRKGRNRAVCMGCGKSMRRPREYKGGELIRCQACREAKK
jgi:hypothetical protein